MGFAYDKTNELYLLSVDICEKLPILFVDCNNNGKLIC